MKCGPEVQKYVPDQERRLFLSTFHSFCADVLRQHGAHLGINPNFHIYSQDSDLQSVLDDAVTATQDTHDEVTDDLRKSLPVISRLKSRLIFPDEAKGSFSDSVLGAKFAIVYEAYEKELAKRNALDFNSLILKAYELFDNFPPIADRYRKVYKYICIDEFQDTNLAQYQLIRSITGNVYKNVFVVADDDQIIYQWNGASHKRIEEFAEQYEPKLIQLPVNYRCPSEVVDIANKLISHNFRRTKNKKALKASRASIGGNVVRLLSGFQDEEAEALAVSRDIKKIYIKQLNKVVVLARNRRLLELMKSTLETVSINSVIYQRRDSFESTPFQLLIAILSLADDRQDKKNLISLCGTYRQVFGIKVDPEMVETQANLSNRDLLQHWHKIASEESLSIEHEDFLNQVQRDLILSVNYQAFIKGFLTVIDEIIDKDTQSVEHEKFYRYDEEKQIWNNLVRGIKNSLGRNLSLDAFLHELQMRPKDPIITDNTVSLMTIHGAKGKEFNHVYLVGLVEDELPSYQSIQKGDDSVEIEEERRNCFVAITRTEDTLVLSYANSYRGWQKRPSRFLYEMNLIEENFDF